MDFLEGFNIEPQPVTKASTAIYEQIKRKIIDREIMPGERLPSERYMMEQFQRSRPTVREALRLLEMEGYITTVSGKRGAVVKKLSSGTIERPLVNMISLGKISNEELVSFRAFNDKTCLEWAVLRRTDKDISVIADILYKEEKLNQASLGHDNLLKEMMALDIEFHKSVSRSAHNPVAYTMSKVMTNIYFQRLSGALMEMFLTTDELQNFNLSICTNHRAILQALEERNLNNAIHASEDNTRSYREKIMSAKN